MGSHKFNVKNMERLNNPKRLEILDLRKVCSHFKLRDQMVLIDVGTGTGLFAEAFLKLLPEARCYALDIQPKMVEWIRENRETYKAGRLIPMVMAEAKIPLEDNIADFLFMITLHHELDQPVELMRECHRVLKSGGRLLVADWKKEAEMGPPRGHRIDASVAISHLEMAGFKEIAAFDGSKSLFCIGAAKL